MKKPFVAVLLLALAACATPYKQMGLMGGVDEVRLNANTWQITARGNGYTGSERVRDFVLLRASELALTNGYHYFTFAGMTDESRTGSFTTSGHATTTTTGVITGTPTMATGSAISTTTYTPPITYSFFKPGAAVTVIMNNSDGMDAQIINAQLAPKYGIALTPPQ